MNYAVVVLGGADGAVSTYQRVAELGYRTICVDIRPAAPAVGYADEYLHRSVRAPEQIAAALAGRDDIVGVLCPASDMGLASQAWLSRHWNLPDAPSDAAVRLSVDKLAFRRTCEKIGAPGYGCVGGRPGPELVEAARTLRFPALVKPVDSSGSRGVVACASPDRLPEAMTEALCYSPSGSVTVEEFIDGTPYTIEVLVLDGTVAFHATSERTLTPPPYFVTSAHLLPGRLSPGTEAAMIDSINALCAEIGYRSGPMTLDGVLGRDGQLYLIEMSARMGGNGLADAIVSCYGVDLIEASLAVAVGRPVPLRPHPPVPTLVHVLASDRGGVLTEIKGLAEVRDMPEVTQLQIFAEPGTLVRPYQQAGYKLGQVVLRGRDEAEVRSVEAKVRGTLKFLLAEQELAVPLP